MLPDLHEFDQEHEGVRDEHENTMNTRTNNPIQSGLFSKARTTFPIEALKEKTQGRSPERKIGESNPSDLEG